MTHEITDQPCAPTTRIDLLCQCEARLRNLHFVRPGFTAAMPFQTRSEAVLTDILLTIDREEAAVLSEIERKMG